MNELQGRTQFFADVANALLNARATVRTAINAVMVYTYYDIGRKIVEEEQAGKERAEYGQKLVTALSESLRRDYGLEYSAANLKLIRRFYIVYSKEKIGEKYFPQSLLSINDSSNYVTNQRKRKFALGWSHYIRLMRIDDEDERHFYEIEAAENHWTLAELKRQLNSALYQRLRLSSDKAKVKSLALVGQRIETPRDLVKDPYVFEFVGLPKLQTYSESDLESRIIEHLKDFLLELGKGFSFVGRQQRFTCGEDHFIVDLVFYNRLLRCFVLFDLKIGELKHQDIGQMQMYVNYYDRQVKLEDENPTIGVILCRDKNNAVVEMTLPKDNNRIFASKYKTFLPTKGELRSFLEMNEEEDETAEIVEVTKA